ncbi:MAG: PqqD family protein [Clostridia bacterium]|nr:PqqD family protein [Clostridia bacterium]
MQIKPGFMLKEVAGTNVVVPVGENSVDFNAMITLNESGAFLWQALQNECDAEDLVAALTSEYDVDANTARKDIDKFIATISGAGLLK